MKPDPEETATPEWTKGTTLSDSPCEWGNGGLLTELSLRITEGLGLLRLHQENVIGIHSRPWSKE